MPGKLNVGNVDVAFFHGKTDGKSQTLGSKSPGLGHPVMTDLGIFDSWCFRFSWKIPREGKNGGAGVGHRDLGWFYPGFPGLEGWVTPKLCPGVFFPQTKEDPGVGFSGVFHGIGVRGDGEWPEFRPGNTGLIQTGGI